MAAGNVDQVLDYLDQAVARLDGNEQRATAVEVALSTLYACVAGDAAELSRVDEHWASMTGQPSFQAWRALVRFAREQASGVPSSASLLEATVPQAPRLTAFLVGAEAARLIWNDRGGGQAWEFLRRARTFETLETFDEVPELHRDGPLLCDACCTLLELAAVNGDWARTVQIRGKARGFWPKGHTSLASIELAFGEASVHRGDYRVGLQGLEPRAPSLTDGVRARWLALQLHALVASGGASSEATRATLQAFLDLDARGAIPAQEREQLWSRVRQIASSDLALKDILEDAPTVLLPKADAADVYNELFEAENAAMRHPNIGRRIQACAKLLERVETAVQGAQRIEQHAIIRLQLLWCRLVVACDQAHAFDACETLLAALIDRCRELGVRPLLMSAYDQRGLLRARFEPPDLLGAVADSNEATSLAIQLLNTNTDPLRPALRRALLRSLLPILDRVIEAHAIAAARAREKLGGRPDAFDARLWQADDARGSWQRLGRRLHGFATQAQQLALADARRARANAEAVAESISSIDPRLPPTLAALQDGLSPNCAVLQYFLVGSYLLVFAYGKRFFDWYLEPVGDAESAERGVVALVSELRDWTQGEEPQSVGAFHQLQSLLMPGGLQANLERARIEHLCVVPHGALYRVPFGRLGFGGDQLATRLALSLHPTPELAVHSVALLPPSLSRRAAVGHVVGPEADVLVRPVGCMTVEAGALTAGFGGMFPVGLVQTIEAWHQELSAVVRRFNEQDVLHFTCHGQEGGAFGQSASMQVARPPKGRLDAKQISQLQLSRCTLVVLQSCWTGWMDHQRENPVQGIPQAFCDAGVAAVIAPLTQIPMALTATFSSVFYRALRWLPAEKALQRTLQVLRQYGAIVVRDDPLAMAAFNASGGSFDRLEYRYTGVTGVRLGGWLSRLWGRLAFWRFQRGLAREARRQGD